MELAEQVYGELVEWIRPGLTEIEVVAELEYRLRRRGSGPLPFDPIVASGHRSSLPHAQPGERKISKGELILLDFGARVDGYCSDLTRVIVLGRAQEWQCELYASVRRACELAIDAVAPEVPASRVDAAARDHLRSLDLADHFGHSTRHGLGLEVHEAPRLHWSEEGVLEAGNVVTIEPGVYLPGRGGIRLEQDVLVEPGGRRILGSSETNLLQL